MNLLNVEKEKLTQLLESVFTDEQTPGFEAAQLESSCLLLETAIHILSQVYTPERIAKLRADDSTRLLLTLRQTAESLKNTLLQTIAALPSQADQSITATLNRAAAELSAGIAEDTEELQYAAEDVEKKIDEARKLRGDISAAGKELETYYSEVRKLEERLKLYAAADRRINNSLPNILEGAGKKLNEVESLLGEIDKELKKVLEIHQQGMDVMQKITT